MYYRNLPEAVIQETDALVCKDTGKIIFDQVSE